jgi:tRNA (pseudouridine54-N1)-methyltransferase
VPSTNVGVLSARRLSRRFVVIGRKATASADFSLEDLPSSSGRLDVLLRCLRAALLVSHGVRQDTVVYLVLLGGVEAPRTLRVDGRTATFLRPDEQSLARMVRKVLATNPEPAGFTPASHGIAVARGGLDAVVADLGPFAAYVLDEGALDVRKASLDLRDPVFFLGDHLGLDEGTRGRLAGMGASPISVGPVSVHADDAIAVVVNELDRREDDERMARPSPS